MQDPTREVKMSLENSVEGGEKKGIVGWELLPCVLTFKTEMDFLSLL